MQLFQHVIASSKNSLVFHSFSYILYHQLKLVKRVHGINIFFPFYHLTDFFHIPENMQAPALDWVASKRKRMVYSLKKSLIMPHWSPQEEIFTSGVSPECLFYRHN